MNVRLKNITLWSALTLAVCCLCACNARKKNTALSRQYTAFITRYNIHYNGDKHYVETLHDMETNYEDDYTQLVYAHPAEARANTKAPQPQGDFTRSIEKAQKAIQLRSITKKPARKRGRGSDPEYKAWLKRDEYNPFLHNDWLMMGRSQYMNGDFLGAASTFFYTSRHFSWLPNTVVEAKLWQARSYLAMDWLFEAETIITRIKPDEVTTKTNRLLYNLDFAELRIKEKDYAAAAPYLEEAIKLSSGAQRTRLQFLCGQIYERAGDNARAYAMFGKAAGSNSASYRTKFNARIRQSEVFSGSDIKKEVGALRRMTRYDRNKEYLDQIYYAIGNLYLTRHDTVNAIRNYETAVEKSTRGGIDKALAQIRLGGLYYDRREYELAQPCYSQGVPALPENYPNIDVLKRRSDVLDELAVYSQNVNLQDSLLRLADMDSLRRAEVINGVIRELVRQEKEAEEEARRQEYEANKSANEAQMNTNNKAPQQFSINNDDSWYFYNTAARTAGKQEFQRKWGNRKQEDNWRRRNKASFSLTDIGAATDSDTDQAPADSTSAEEPREETADEMAAAQRAEDPHYPEYYMAQIPFSDDQKQNARDIIQEGLYNMGVILKDKMEDFPAAETSFDRLLTEFPDNIYRLDTYYNLYLMNMRRNDTARAEHYRQLILTDFPDSKYALALQNPNYIQSLRDMETQQQTLYDRAYQAYMDNDNAQVHAIYDDVGHRFPMSRLMPKFMFLQALAYVTDRKPDEFKQTLKTLLERYPDTDLTPTVSSWLKGLNDGRKLQSTATNANMRSMIWNVSLGSDSTHAAADSIAFTLNPQDRQLLVFVFPTDRVSTNQLLYDIARHNFRSFVVKDFDLEPMNYGRLGMIAVKDFADLKELNHYRRVMAESPDFKLPAGVRPVVISVPNFDALLHSGGTLEDYFRFLEEQNYKDAQADILPYTELETLDDATEADSLRRTEPTPAKTVPEPGAPETAPAPAAPEVAPAPAPAQTVPEPAAPETAPEKPEKTEPLPPPYLEPDTVAPAPAQPVLPVAEPAEPAKPAVTPAPAQTVPEPAAPDPASAKKPAQKPAQKPASPKPAPAQKPAAPVPAPKPALPQYDPGSEGDDDPLLEP